MNNPITITHYTKSKTVRIEFGAEKPYKIYHLDYDSHALALELIRLNALNSEIFVKTKDYRNPLFSNSLK
jgi:hypothetical protein